MRIVCVGAGPAALYFAIMMKLRSARHDITIFERNPAGRTYGWGVVFWDDLVEKLRFCDPESASTILDSSARWSKQVLHTRGKQTVHSGRGGYSISRQRLLDILAQRATGLGVNLRFNTEVDRIDHLPAADLIAACDGAGSRLRQLHASHFKTQTALGRNKYIWLGATKAFEAFTFALVETRAGRIWFHGYRFDADLSTCVVECPPETWHGLGFDQREPKDTLSALHEIFVDALDGGHLRIGGGSSWLNFRTVTNDTWHHERIILMGDAAHTTHFTIGSGTKLAFEDAIALAAKLHEHRNFKEALAAYEKERRAALRQPQGEARLSALWFENLSRYASLNDEQFFTLLRERRSPLLPHVPPWLYYRMHRATTNIPILGKLRHWIGPQVRAALSRWNSAM